MFTRTSGYSRLTVVAFSAVALSTIAFLATSETSAAAQTPCLITTANGDIAGVRRGGVCAYLGIPYAAPPVGNLRWRPPQPRAPWAPAPLNATAPAAACPQINPAGAFTGNEDCLTLNVWAPPAVPTGRGAPVLVWLHAGSFLGASSNLAANDGARFAEERRAVVVIPNYRIGALGWLVHRSLTEEDPHYMSSGNYGLADQRAAIRWVREHIASFGGDPDNVTVAGSSAGSISTSLHLVSPASRGLFHRAIMHSGFGSSRLDSMSDGEAQGESFATALGCTDPNSVIACLRSKTPNQVLAALPLATLTGGFQQFTQEPGRVVWGPVVDGLQIPDQPRELYRRGRFSRIPIILGTTRDDGWTFAERSFPAGLDALQYDRAVRAEFGMDADAVLQLYPATRFATPKDALAQLAGDVEFACEARRLARMLHHDGAPVYLYSFRYTVDAVTPGRAFHGIDTNLLFGNNFGPPSNHVLAPDDVRLFATMSSYWRQFAETGNPNAPGQIPWPLFRAVPATPADPDVTDHYLVLDRSIQDGIGLRDQPCNFWESLFFRSALGAVPASAR